MKLFFYFLFKMFSLKEICAKYIISKNINYNNSKEVVLDCIKYIDSYNLIEKIPKFSEYEDLYKKNSLIIGKTCSGRTTLLNNLANILNIEKKLVYYFDDNDNIIEELEKIFYNESLILFDDFYSRMNKSTIKKLCNINDLLFEERLNLSTKIIVLQNFNELRIESLLKVDFIFFGRICNINKKIIHELFFKTKTKLRFYPFLSILESITEENKKFLIFNTKLNTLYWCE